MERNITTSDLQRLASVRHGPAAVRSWLLDGVGYRPPIDRHEIVLNQLVKKTIPGLEARWGRRSQVCVLATHGGTLGQFDRPKLQG